MKVQIHSRREIAELVRPGSPIEELMSELLEGAPGLQTRAGFAVTDDWRKGLESLRREPDVLARHRMVVFAQPKVLSYRPDFLVVARGMSSRPGWHGDRNHAFFVECDGAGFHSAESGNLRADLRRASEIERATGLDLLRFSGAEINFCLHAVEEIIASKVEILSAIQEFDEKFLPKDLIYSLQDQISLLAGHPALRPEYHTLAAFSLPAADHPTSAIQLKRLSHNRLTVDPVASLRTCLGTLREAVATFRAIGPSNLGDDDIPGGLVPIGDILARVLRQYECAVRV